MNKRAHVCSGLSKGSAGPPKEEFSKAKSLSSTQQKHTITIYHTFGVDCVPVIPQNSMSNSTHYNGSRFAKLLGSLGSGRMSIIIF